MGAAWTVSFVLIFLDFCGVLVAFFPLLADFLSVSFFVVGFSDDFFPTITNIPNWRLN